MRVHGVAGRGGGNGGGLGSAMKPLLLHSFYKDCYSDAREGLWSENGGYDQLCKVRTALSVRSRSHQQGDTGTRPPSISFGNTAST